MEAHDFSTVKEVTLASMHGKEQAIAPWFQSELGIDLKVASNFDTDQFGTFSGEIERVHNPEQTARLKIDALFQQNPHCRVGLASEGSFFPNPESILSTVNEELLLLIDRDTKFEVMVKHYANDTNLAKDEISSEAELLDFANRIGFPGHAIILKTDDESAKQELWKGITSKQVLISIFHLVLAKSKTGKVLVETDMRACFNPTRMANIGHAAQKLVQLLKTPCPSCSYPGFGVTEQKSGLPCENCGAPTRLVLSNVCKCKNCNFIAEEKFPSGKQTAYAGFCNFCNP